MKLLFIGTYPPTRCGIATFTHHLRQGILDHGERDEAMFPVAAIWPDEQSSTVNAHYTIRKHHREDYLTLAKQINASDVDVISLQHEFGIFGGEAGEYIVSFLEDGQKTGRSPPSTPCSKNRTHRTNTFKPKLSA